LFRARRLVAEFLLCLRDLVWRTSFRLSVRVLCVRRLPDFMLAVLRFCFVCFNPTVGLSLWFLRPFIFVMVFSALF